MMNREYPEETPRSGMPPADDLPEMPAEDTKPFQPPNSLPLRSERGSGGEAGWSENQASGGEASWSQQQTPARPMSPVSEDDDYLPSRQLSQRQSKARERIEKRKQQGHAVPVGTRMSIPRQISVPSSLPKINLSIGRNTLYVIGSVLLVVIVIVGLGLLRNQPPEVLPNALWIGTEWTYDEYTDDQLRALVQRLRDNKIGTVYAWVSYLQEDNTWRQQTTGAWDRVKLFRERLKALYPQVEIFGWVSLNTSVGDGDRLDEPDVIDLVANLSAEVITDFQFDGVFLNIEPVWDGDQNFLELLRKVRGLVGADIPVAAAIPPDWSPLGVDFTIPAIIAPGTVWSTEYKQNVALLVDQLAVMAYNSTLASPADYSRWVAYQVETYALALAESEIDTEILIGIPTYDAELPGHDPLIETVPAAIDGIRLGIENVGDAAQYVRGAAIYAGWTTDDTEWSQFKRDWVD